MEEAEVEARDSSKEEAEVEARDSSKEDCGSDDVVFIVTDHGNDSSQPYEMIEVREDELMEDHEIAAITAQEHELTLSLQEDRVDASEGEEEDDVEESTTLSHLTKREFTKRVESQFPTELSVLKLRDKLAGDIRDTDKSALKGSLLTRSGSKRITSMSRYIADCYTLQRYIDGDEIVDIDTLLSKMPVKKTLTKLSTLDMTDLYVEPKSTSASAKQTTTKSPAKAATRSSVRVPNKSKQKVQLMKSKLKDVKQNNTQKTAKLHGTIKDLREELKQLKEAMHAMQKNRSEEEEEEEVSDADDADDGGEPRVTYGISEEMFTNRGGRKLVASDGHIYIIKRTSEKNGVQTLLWRCHRRFRNNGCPATVKQRGDIFLPGAYEHDHEDFPDFNLYAAGIMKEDMSRAGDGSVYMKDMGGGCIKEFKFECPSCEACFIYRKHLEEHHLQIHGARYTCVECSKGFNDHATYKEYRLCVHTDNKPFSCTVCAKQFHMKKALRKHAKTHGPKIRNHICYDCGKAYHSADILTKHMKSHSIPHHLCTTCGKLFKTKNHLRSHVNIHTRERIYRCNWCEKEFTHPTHLVIHVRRHHTGERPFPCNYCEKRYVSRSECKEHERVHTGNKRPKKPKSEYAVAQVKKRKLIHTGPQRAKKAKKMDLHDPVDYLMENTEEDEYASNVLSL